MELELTTQGYFLDSRVFGKIDSENVEIRIEVWRDMFLKPCRTQVAQEEMNKGVERVFSKHIDDLKGWIEEPKNDQGKPRTMKEARTFERSKKTLKETLSLSGPGHIVVYPRAKFFTLMHEVADSLHGYYPAAKTKEPTTSNDWRIFNRETVCTPEAELPALFEAAYEICPIRQIVFKGDPEKTLAFMESIGNGRPLERINGQVFYTVKKITEEKHLGETREDMVELDDKMWEYDLSAKVFCDKIIN